MATSVYAFNCSPLQVALTVRSGFTPYTFNGASPTSSTPWIPQTPNTAIPWGGTNPGANQLGFGNNPCVLNDGQHTTSFNLNIPLGVLPTTSLEIYLFYAPPSSSSGNGAVSYVLLNDGLPIGGSLNIPS
jgi:hypothetical protein